MEADYRLNYQIKNTTNIIFTKMIYDTRIKNLFDIKLGCDGGINLFLINSQNIVLKNYRIFLRVENVDLYDISVFENDQKIYPTNKQKSYEDIISTLLLIAEVI